MEIAFLYFLTGGFFFRLRDAVLEDNECRNKWLLFIYKAILINTTTFPNLAARKSHIFLYR